MPSFLERLFNLVRPTKIEPADDVRDGSRDPQDESHEQLRDRIRRDIASGFYDNKQILQQAADSMDGEIEPDLLHTLAASMLEEELAAHAAEQRNWPTVTDCDRLDAAFGKLEARGIVARQNFTCCGTCGTAEISDEAAAMEATGKPVHGYAFYHMQDTDNAVDGYGLYLNYGAAEGGEAAALEIAQKIIAQLEAQGFEIDWEGSWNKRIGFAIDWKRRRTA